MFISDHRSNSDGLCGGTEKHFKVRMEKNKTNQKLINKLKTRREIVVFKLLFLYLRKQVKITIYTYYSDDHFSVLFKVRSNQHLDF